MPEIDPEVLEQASKAVESLRAEIERMGGATAQLRASHESIRSAAGAVGQASSEVAKLAAVLGGLATEVGKLQPEAVARELQAGMGEVARVRGEVEHLAGTLATQVRLLEALQAEVGAFKQGASEDFSKLRSTDERIALGMSKIQKMLTVSIVVAALAVVAGLAGLGVALNAAMK